MSSPYTSALLRDPSPAERNQSQRPLRRREQAPLPAYAASQAMVPYAPAPMMIAAPAARPSSRMANLGYILLAIVLAIAVGIGAYEFATQSAPTTTEVNGYQNIAAQQGFFTGQQNGFQQGKTFAEQSGAEIAKIKGLIAQQKQYNKGFNQGKNLGARSYRNAYRGYGYGRGCGYSCSYGGYYGGGVSGAVAQAQALANATGQEVDVTIP